MNAAIAPSAPTTAGATSYSRPPQVNLLPPEVHAARGLRTVKRWAVLGLASCLLLVGLVYAASAFQLAQARDDLTAAQSDTTRLQQEMTQYAEVPLVLNELEQVEQARTLGGSTEVLWRPYLDAVRAALPAEATLRSLGVTGATPITSAAPPMDPLQPQSVGQLTFTAVTPAVPDAAAWSDALAAIPGLVDPRIQSVVRDEATGTAGYLVTGTVQYDESALSGRYSATEEEG